MKKKTKALLLLTTAAASMYAYNKYVEEHSTRKNLLKDHQGKYYDWKLGKVYYEKEGSGSPILFIHDITPTASSYDWKKLTQKLSKNHTVYTLDLLGCGRSDKPEIAYTNYMYVQLLTSFIKNIIKDKCTLVGSNLSTSIIIMLNNMESELINHIILINPVSLKQLQITPDAISKLKKTFINLPLVGTFVYNIIYHPLFIKMAEHKKYKEKKSTSKAIDIQYEAAHLFQGKGKYLFSSLLGNYMNIDIYHALKKAGTIHIISSKNMKENISIANEYHKVNTKIQVHNVTSNQSNPQIDNPLKVSQIIEEIM